MAVYTVYIKKRASFEEYLEHACECDMSKIEYNEKLSQQLKSLSHRKIFYTDSHYQHVEEALKRLKLHGFFEYIYR